MNTEIDRDELIAFGLAAITLAAMAVLQWIGR